MKNKVKFSIYSQIVTVAVLVVCLVGLFSLYDDSSKLILFCIIFGIVIISGGYYCPKSVEADRQGITLNRLMSKPKFFPYDAIQKVDTCYPSAGGIRLCGSGGFFGYWGYFSDIMIGVYFGYYGSRDQCFLVRLKNGRQYVIGCENSRAVVDYIKTQMDKMK